MSELGGTRMAKVPRMLGRKQPIIRGSCLCGALRYEIDGDVELMANRSCSL